MQLPNDPVDEMSQCQDEIYEFMQKMSDKYFISSWAVQIAIRHDTATTDGNSWNGSEPEVVGLATNFLSDMRENRKKYRAE